MVCGESVRVKGFFLTVLCILLVVGLAQAESPRTALVIGNADYANAPLRTPVNDATDVAKALTQLGYDVILLTDARLREMEDGFARFTRHLRQGGLALFYFAGHGIQVHGENFLIPVEARISREQDVRFEALPVRWVIDKMQATSSGLNLIILDASRKNPFMQGWSSPQRGLAPIQAGVRSIIAYSAAPGDVTEDGKGRNGTYTKHLLRHITTPGLRVEHMLRNVRVDVMQETQGRQAPWESSSLTGDVNLVPEDRIIVPPQIASERSKDSSDVRVKESTTTYRLTVVPTPADSRISILNITRDYRPGMSLMPGLYNIQIERKGYFTARHLVRIQDSDVTVEVSLSPEAYTLMVHVTPPDSRVRIMNIQQPYYPGMRLPPGMYDILVDRKGYESATQLITIRDTGVEVHITLTKTEYPHFPWPPPEPSAREELPAHLLNMQPDKVYTLRDIERTITAALNACDYAERSYYTIPGGFALVTRLERIYSDGTPYPDRWSTAVKPLQQFDLRAYLRALFTANRGHYRIIVFVVTPVPFAPSQMKVPRHEAMRWISKGISKLPQRIGEEQYSPRHNVTALIYEFEQHDTGMEATLNRPGRLAARKHLQKARFWAALEK